MNIKFSPPDIEQKELDAVIQVLKSGWITTGPKTIEFENELSNYIKTKKTIALNSASSCLELTLRFLGIGPGDEVITTPYTYTATASAIHHVGAKIVFCDLEKDTYFMDLNKLKKLININTKAIIPVDIAGVVCDYQKIYDIIKDFKFSANNKVQETYNRIVIIADAAHSFGAERNKEKTGTHADFTYFSFHAVKNLTCAEGGALTWKDVPELDIYKEIKLLSLNGQTKSALEKTNLGSWEYDIVNLGYKCNMTDINAVLGLSQLKRYVDLLEKRKNIIEQYDKQLSSYCDILKHYTKDVSSSGHLYLTRPKTIKTEEQRNELIEKLATLGIPCNVHYKPLPMMTAYKNIGFNIKDYPNAYNQYKNEITLPLHSLLKQDEIDYIINTYIDLIK